jgi:hypothetical protein
VWAFSDGALEDINPYGNVTNNGSARTPKGALDAVAASARNLTDDPIDPNDTLVRAIHVNELRAAINLYREAAGFSALMFTDPDLSTGTTVRAVHVEELRSALLEARSGLGLAVIGFTDTSLTDVPIKAVHLQEIREALK